jgi:putative transposase
MVNYRRNKIDSTDALYFLTIVTRDRRRLFREREDFVLLWRVMQRVAQRFEAVYPAWVLLPNHLHWLLRPGRADHSDLVFAFKRGVGAEFKKAGQLQSGTKLWQDRFWEHTIRDEDDAERCMNYIHYNPVKHGLVEGPREWRYSSFCGFVKEGLYSQDWGDGRDIVVFGAEWDL